MSATLYHGDCLAVLPTLAENSIDSIVTDPPYHLTQNSRGGSPRSNDPATPFGRHRLASKGFMQKVWDGGSIAFEVATWQAALRVLKPGGHLLAFGGTRTIHRMISAIEDAGFEIREQICWLYGTGMPKSRNLGGRWAGYGSGLKPAMELIVLARKPLDAANIAENMERWGTGALHIAACRVPIDPAADASQLRTMNRGVRTEDTSGQVWGLSKLAADTPQVVRPDGRWPANVILDGSDEVIDSFAAYGERKACMSASAARSPGSILGGSRTQGNLPMDHGTAARYFYSAKANKADRCGSQHPTVKPVSLMSYLVKLVTPAAGLVLDPFAGSGSTGQAAVEAGFRTILVEREAEYVGDIRRRLGFFLTAEHCLTSPAETTDDSV